MKSLIACLLVIPLMAVSGNHLMAQDTAQTTDWSDWNGIWKPAMAQVSGQELPSETIQSMTLGMKDGAFDFQMTGLHETGKLKITPPTEEGKPGPLDVIIEDGPNKGNTVLAIYKSENDKLTICYAAAGKERPTGFASTTDNNHVLIEYEKQDEK